MGVPLLVHPLFSSSVVFQTYQPATKGIVMETVLLALISFLAPTLVLFLDAKFED